MAFMHFIIILHPGLSQLKTGGRGESHWFLLLSIFPSRVNLLPDIVPGMGDLRGAETKLAPALLLSPVQLGRETSYKTWRL